MTEDAWDGLLLRAAAAVDGRDVEPVEWIVGADAGRRSLVARVLVDGRSALVKAPATWPGPPTKDPWSPAVQLVSEMTALEELDGAGAPRLLGADVAAGAIVMEDLGSQATLATVLLASSRARAVGGVEAWAAALAQVHGATAATEDRWRARFAAHGQVPLPDERATHEALALRTLAGEHDLEAAVDGLDGAVTWIDERLHDRAWWALSPRDTCPDNVLLTPGGATIIDFEAAGHRHVLLDVAYLHASMPTCWCTARIPDDVRAAGVAAYLSASGRSADELGEHLAAATAFHCLWSLVRRLGHALAPTGDSTQRITAAFSYPGPRAVVLRSADDLALAAADHPALAPLAAAGTRFADALLARWPDSTASIPHPAFRT